LKLKGPGVGVKPGILADVTNAMKLEGINIKSVLTSQTIISFLLSSNDLYKAYQLLQNLDVHGVNEVEIQDKISLIAIVGEGLNDTHGIAAKLFNAISRKGINAKVVSMGISDVASYFIVDSDQRNEAIKSIHEEFFYEKHR
jgi:aspartate kinase/aspartokinase/homoserine dehydrogenase 1